MRSRIRKTTIWRTTAWALRLRTRTVSKEAIQNYERTLTINLKTLESIE